jgi:hypothetical protein
MSLFSLIRNLAHSTTIVPHVAAKCVHDLMAMGKEADALVLISHLLQEIEGEIG